MLLSPDHLRIQYPWIAVCGFGTLLAIGLQSHEYLLHGTWARGSSVLGFTLGVAGGLIILFEFLLWPRKDLLRHWRIGQTAHWMAAHIWLGLLSIPLIVFHTGFRFNGWWDFNTLLTIVFAVVIVSGIVGWLLQQRLPKYMTQKVPQETVHVCIDEICQRLYDDAVDLINAVCEGGNEFGWTDSARKSESTNYVGKPRTITNITGFTISDVEIVAPLPNTQPLRRAFDDLIGPYLKDGQRGSEDLGRIPSARQFFDRLKGDTDLRAIPTIEILQHWCDLRRQFDLQRRIHFGLHAWVIVHLPLSVLLVLLMLTHVWYALVYI